MKGTDFCVFSLGTTMLSFELWVCCCFSNSGDSRDWMRRLKFLRRYCQISLDPLIPYEVAAAAGQRSIAVAKQAFMAGAM